MTVCGSCGSDHRGGRRHCPSPGAGGDRDEAGQAAAAPPVGGAGGADPSGADAGTAVIVDLSNTLPLTDDELADAEPAGGPGPAAGAGQRAQPGTAGRRLLGVLLVAVGLALVAAGSYTAYQNRHPRGAPPTVRSVPATPTAGAPTPTGPATGSPPVSTPTVSPATAAPDGVVVTVAPALSGQPDVAAVAATLGTYFTAINERDYDTYRAVLVGAQDRVGGEQDFLRRFRSTTDSDVRLVGLRHDGDGTILATVTFRSTQDPVDAPDGASPCVSWVLTYPLVAEGGDLLIDVVHPFAQTYRPC